MNLKKIKQTVLERNLNLVMHAQALSRNVIVCCNLIDEAKKKGIIIDKEKLSKHLNAPIVFTSATNKQGLDELMEEIEKVASLPNLNSKTDNSSKLFNAEDNFKKAEYIVSKCVTFTKKNYLALESYLMKI